MISEEDYRYIELLKASLTASIYDESAWQLAGNAVQIREGEGRHLRSIPDRILKGILRSAASHSFALVKQTSFDRKKREEGIDWPLFGYTMIGHKRLDNIQACTENVVAEGIPGDLVETGVWRGGAVIFMRAMLRVLGVADRKIWAVDSFEGLPEPESNADGQNLANVDYLKASLEQVRHNFQRFGLLDDQVCFLQGWFKDTLPTAPIKDVAVLRLDGDLYSSTMDSLINLYHKISPGGYLIIDDYHSWEPCKRAVHEFFDGRGEQPKFSTIDWSGVYLRVKD